MIKSFEGARGIAALLVALFHLKIGADAVSFIGNGYLFVDLFFVLSGYVICSSYSERLSTYREIRSFVIRRFGRLFPLLIFSSICYVAGENVVQLGKHVLVESGYGAVLQTPNALAYTLPSFSEVVATLTMTQGMGVFDRLILNYVNWSISTEFYTYLLFAICCFLLQGSARRIAFAILSVAGLALSIWATVVLHDCLNKGMCLDVSYDFGIARCIASFFLGALVFYAKKNLTFNANRLQLIALALFAAFFYMVISSPAVALLSPLLFALLVLALSSDSGFAADLLNRRPFQLIGQRSYSIYMMHPFVLLFVRIVTRADYGNIGSVAVLAGYMLILITVSGWSYRWIENPMRNFFNRIAATQERIGKGLAAQTAQPSSGP